MLHDLTKWSYNKVNNKVIQKRIEVLAETFKNTTLDNVSFLSLPFNQTSEWFKVNQGHFTSELKGDLMRPNTT